MKRKYTSKRNLLFFLVVLKQMAGNHLLLAITYYKMLRQKRFTLATGGLFFSFCPKNSRETTVGLSFCDDT